MRPRSPEPTGINKKEHHQPRGPAVLISVLAEECHRRLREGEAVGVLPAGRRHASGGDESQVA
jgi:predicted methyltransferase MtxX (methanogen marker protein 4)